MKNFIVTTSVVKTGLICTSDEKRFETCDAAIEYAICFAATNPSSHLISVYESVDDGPILCWYTEYTIGGKTVNEKVHEKAAALVDYWKSALKKKNARIATLNLIISTLQAELEKAQAELAAIAG